MADMSQDDLDSIFGGEEGAEPPPAEVSSEESVVRTSLGEVTVMEKIPQ